MSFDDSFTEQDREIRHHALLARITPGRQLAEEIVAGIQMRYRLGENELSKTYTVAGLTRREVGFALSIVRATYPGYEFLEIEYADDTPNKARVTMLW